MNLSNAVVAGILGTLLAGATFTLPARAQDKDAKERTITGCLRVEKDDADDFRILGNDESEWDVSSDTVKFAPHAGHTVTLTGTVRLADVHAVTEKVREEAAEHGLAKPGERGHLVVKELKMVSATCTPKKE